MAPTLWEYDAFGNKTKETWKLADPATVSNSRITTWSYGVDFNKNVSEVFDAQGTIAAAYDYSPYGAVTGTGSLVQPVQWLSLIHI